MKRKNPPMAWDLPLVIDPPDTVCFQINVPNERFHLAAFYGAMYLLTRWYAWKPDDAHTGRLVGKVWMRIFDRLIGGNCTIPPKLGSSGADSEDNLIRQNPDNPCLLETSINGVDWCAFADLSLCTPPPAQPGGGSEQPTPGGGCVTYHGTMGAKEPWYVPTQVSTGDTIEIVGSEGAWTGGDFSRWYCADGERFVGGACVGLQSTDSGDPLPTAPHMSMIAKIGSTYYDLSSGPITVGGGVTNEQVLIYPNDSDLSDNAGTITFDVKVCNNQTTAWTSFFDFTANPYAELMTLITGHFEPGVGLVGDNFSSGELSFTAFQFVSMAVQINTMTMRYDCAGHAGGSQILAFVQNSGYFGTPTTPTTGTNLVYGQVLDATADNPGCQVCSGSDVGPVSLRNLLVAGEGPKPADWP